MNKNPILIFAPSKTKLTFIAFRMTTTVAFKNCKTIYANYTKPFNILKDLVAAPLQLQS